MAVVLGYDGVGLFTVPSGNVVSMLYPDTDPQYYWVLSFATGAGIMRKYFWSVVGGAAQQTVSTGIIGYTFAVGTNYLYYGTAEAGVPTPYYIYRYNKATGAFVDKLPITPVGDGFILSGLQMFLSPDETKLMLPMRSFTTFLNYVRVLNANSGATISSFLLTEPTNASEITTNWVDRIWARTLLGGATNVIYEHNWAGTVLRTLYPIDFGYTGLSAAIGQILFVYAKEAGGSYNSYLFIDGATSTPTYSLKVADVSTLTIVASLTYAAPINNGRGGFAVTTNKWRTNDNNNSRNVHCYTTNLTVGTYTPPVTGSVTYVSSGGRSGGAGGKARRRLIKNQSFGDI